MLRGLLAPLVGQCFGAGAIGLLGRRWSSATLTRVREPAVVHGSFQSRTVV